MFLQLILVLVVLIPLLAIVLDSQVGRALASRLERLAFLEGEVERLTSEIQRLDEESEFVQRLLGQRNPEQSATLPPGDQRS